MIQDKENRILIAENGKYLTDGKTYCTKFFYNTSTNISKWHEVDEIPAHIINRERVAEIERNFRPLTESEISRMLITQQINTLPVDDNTALRMKAFYPEWAPDTEYTKEANRPVGYKVQHGGKLWRLRQEHTSLLNWEPGAAGTESLWEEVNETHAGTLVDPIPYNGNMALTKGLYYIQDGTIYLCSRDTVNPVYDALKDLVGLYVEAV